MTKESGTRHKKLQTAVVVLGMHRSGTSALAGVLHELGAGLPSHLMPSTSANSKGYFESTELQKFHDTELQRGESAWFDWRPVSDDVFTSERVPEASGLLKSEFGDQHRFLLKDPRMCRLVPFWEKVFEHREVHPTYILTHRNPLDVIASLDKREKVHPQHGFLLWLRHVLDAEQDTRGARRVFISFDLLMENWQACVSRIHATHPKALLSLTPQRTKQIEAFLTKSLRHHTSSPESLLDDPTHPQWVRAAFSIFERWSRTGEESADFDALDGIYRDFNSACQGVGALARLAKRPPPPEIKTLQERLAEKDKALRAQEKKIAALTDQLAIATTSATEEKALRGTEQARAERLEQDLTAAQKHTDEVTAALYQSKSDVHRLRHDLSLHQEQIATLKGAHDLASKRLEVTLDRLDITTSELVASKRVKERQDNRIAALSTEHIRLRTEMERLATAIHQLTESTSWRITRPLRQLSKALKRS